jgi:hypothetical protein
VLQVPVELGVAEEEVLLDEPDSVLELSTPLLVAVPTAVLSTPEVVSMPMLAARVILSIPVVVSSAEVPIPGVTSMPVLIGRTVLSTPLVPMFVVVLMYGTVYVARTMLSTLELPAPAVTKAGRIRAVLVLAPGLAIVGRIRAVLLGPSLVKVASTRDAEVAGGAGKERLVRTGAGHALTVSVTAMDTTRADTPVDNASSVARGWLRMLD